MHISIAFILITSLAFIIYGHQCLTSAQMKKEFIRFGLTKFRILTGCLEIIGGMGLLVGFYEHTIMVISSGGLALLMALGLISRVRSKDGLIVCLPAFILMVINLWIFSIYIN